MNSAAKNFQWLVTGLGLSPFRWSRFLPCSLVIVALLLLVSFQWYRVPAKAQAQAFDDTASRAVGCLGRIQPEDGVWKLAAPSYLGPSLVTELRVKEGDEVEAGQIIAVLDSRDRLEAASLEADSRVKVAQAQLEQVKEGAKAGDLAAQQAEVSRCQSGVTNAQSEFDRYQKLRDANFASDSDLDAKRLVLEQSRQELESAREKLNSLAEVRKVDVMLAEAQLQAAMAQAKQAKAMFDQSFVRSPARGRVLKLHAYPGEAVGDAGIAELGKTDRMYVFAEVYETDISRVAVGQRATMSVDGCSRKLSGSVEQIGLMISKNGLFATDPVAFADNRIVEVKIRLDSSDSQAVAGLIGAKVSVRIGS